MSKHLFKYRHRTSEMTAKLIAAISISSFAGLLWAIEMWTRGWDGLQWINRFHFTIFAVAILVTIFLNHHGNRDRLSYGKVLLIAAPLSVAIHIYFGIAGFFSFVIGPSGMILMLLGDFGLWIGRITGAVMFFAIPAIGMIWGRAFGLLGNIRGFAYGLLVVIFGIGFCPILLDAIPHSGRSDLIHCIKTGIGIPFLVFSFLVPTMVKNPPA